MDFLILAIITNALVLLLFKYYSRRKWNLFKIIMVNYAVCFLVGQLFVHEPLTLTDLMQKPWALPALGLGAIFIIGFNLLALTVRYFGVTVGTLMQRMSFVSTVLFSIVWYGETMTGWKVIGIICGLAALWLFIVQDEKQLATLSAQARKYWWIPLTTFLLSALIEVVLLYLDRSHIVRPADEAFVTALFGSAALFAALSYLFLRLQQKIFSLQWYEIVGGIVLGVINYFSIYYILRALQTKIPGSVLFPILNTGIIALATTAGVWLFREQLQRRQKWGIALAIAALWILQTQR